jgi:hypothetical protein
MKRIYSLVTCFVILALVAGTTSIHAQAQMPDNASVTQITTPADITFAPFFLQDPMMNAVWGQSHTVVDGSGGVHVAFYDNAYIYYAHCADNCSDPANWLILSLFPVGTLDSLDEPTLGVDASGRPRLMWYAEYGGDTNYYYAECNANCINSTANWTSVAVVSLGVYSYPINPRYAALDTQGRPRLVYPMTGGFYYLTCDANCTTASNWNTTTVSTPDLLWPNALQLVFDLNDRPRVLGFDDNTTALLYAECNISCSNAANWGSVGLFAPIYYLGYYSYVLRVDTQGYPRIAYFDGNNNNLLYYAWSNTSPLTPENWSSYTLNYPTNDLYWSLDLALDSQDRPSVAFATYELDLSYVTCTANCETASSIWQQQYIETGDDLDVTEPIPTEPGCVSSSWMVIGYPSLALDAANNPNVSYWVRHAQFCYDWQGNLKPLFDAKSIRFATAGGTVTPTAPVSVTINGPTTGIINVNYSFTATVNPNTTTIPITYVWEATGQTTQTHTGGGISDTVSFTWPAGGTGNKTITVTASNSAGSAVGNSHILITTKPIIYNNQVYLPLTIRQ